MSKRFLSVLIMLCLALVLSACQFSRALNRISPGQPTAAVRPTSTPPSLPPTLDPSSTPKPTLAASATPTAATAPAEQAANAYFKALESKNYKQAAGLVSDFSLMVFSLTRSEVSDVLNSQAVKGAQWSGFTVTGSQLFAENLVLVHVRFSRECQAADEACKIGLAKDAGKTAVDEYWPFRLENGRWFYNWNNLVDFKTLDVSDKSLNNLTLKPTRLVRFSDRIELKLLAQNRSNEVIVLGQSNEILATFQFASQVVEASPVQYILEPLRSYPELTLTVAGLYPAYPGSVDIRKWKDYNVPPWFTFQLTS